MTEKTLNTELQKIVVEYGVTNVKEAVEKLIGHSLGNVIPANFEPVIAPQKLHETLQQLDASTQDIIDKANERNRGIEKRSELLKRKSELELLVDLRKSEALMSIQGEGRNAFGMVGEQKVAVTNDELRKAYATMYAKPEIEDLAKIKAELARLEIENYAAKDEYDAAVTAANNINSKAFVQGNLLKLLGKGL